MPDSSQAKPLILIFPFGLLSHYLRCLALSRQLSRFFDVRIEENVQFECFIKQAGVKTFRCDSLDAPSAVAAMRNFDFSWLNRPGLEHVFLRQVDIIQKLKPIAVLGDHSPTLKMAAEKSSVFFVSLLNGYMSKYYAGTRSISKTHPAYTFLKKLPASLQAILTKQGESTAFRQIHRPFRKLREKYKLKMLYQYADEFEGDFTMVCDLEELFPQLKDLPATYRIISPLFHDPVSINQQDHSLVLDRGKKTIFASMGSSGDWKNLEFLNDLSFMKYNIIATGDQNRVLHESHIIHTPFVNTNDIFPLVDLVICHGGNGTVYQALLHEIPLLCKTSHCEQEWNVQSLEKNELGKSLDNVHELFAYRHMIETWIQQKGNSKFKSVSEKIRKQKLRLPEVVNSLANDMKDKARRVAGSIPVAQDW